MKPLIDRINNLPPEFLESEVCNGELGKLDEEYTYRIDKPIISLTVDEETKEILFLNQLENEIKE